VRICSSCAVAAPSDASVRATALCRFVGSICSRNCPRRTVSPSLMASSVTRPIVSALMFTERFGWIFPEAETIASQVARGDRFDVDLLAPAAREPDVGEHDRRPDQHDDDANQDLLANR
jgi:hypothetical protein